MRLDLLVEFERVLVAMAPRMGNSREKGKKLLTSICLLLFCLYFVWEILFGIWMAPDFSHHGEEFWCCGWVIDSKRSLTFIYIPFGTVGESESIRSIPTQSPMFNIGIGRGDWNNMWP